MKLTLNLSDVYPKQAANPADMHLEIVRTELAALKEAQEMIQRRIVAAESLYDFIKTGACSRCAGSGQLLEILAQDESRYIKCHRCGGTGLRTEHDEEGL